MEKNNEKVEYMYFYKEWFNYMELGADKFYMLMDLISRERFTEEDILPDSVDDIIIRSIWRSIRPTLLKSRRQERYKKKQENIKSDNMSDVVDNRTEISKPLVNCHISPKEEEREKWAERALNNLKKNSGAQTPAPTEITQNMGVSIPNKGASVETEFYGKLREGENRKWIMEYRTFSAATFNPSFKEWLKGRECERSEIERLWERYRKKYLDRVKSEIDVSQGADKEIYDYVKEKRSHNFLSGGFNLACINNRDFVEWMQGYDKTRVEVIFNLVDKEIDAMRKQALAVR